MLQGLDRANRFLQGVCNLLILPALEELEHNHLLLVDSQFLHSGANALLMNTLAGLLFHAITIWQVSAERILRGPTTVIVHYPIVRNSKEVSLQAIARSAANSQGLQESAERLSHAVLSSAGIAQQPKGIAVQARAVKIVNLCQGAGLKLSCLR